ncbi:MAG TPA: toll/interleukin-1 receptor domain-containing protein [Ideonella sp.]|uniref:toll/interleukin-1 receptor domain-containing protein n=1 Tax=Ideonella sp. TaxID=1929293 RepID=UPI002E2F488F|nr:toll/interleukin-1 receptor domain-containing protein [Ideonella sp.]HEX5685664.1 toll/interleukin-1 receptor domain-containing protein [Ideonella sp.]
MAGLFISYAHEDKPFVADLAHALTEAGHAVWWDRALDVGGEFRLQLQAELDAAALVLVVWSERSRVSRFVADEADLALTQGKLLPLLIDRARPALGFGGLHAIDLSTWSRTADDAGFAGLLKVVDERLGAGAQPPPPRPRAALVRPALHLIGATAIATGVAQFTALQAQADAAAGHNGWNALAFVAQHAVLAAVLLLPVGAYAVQRVRTLGLAHWKALLRPFFGTLGWGLLAAVLLVVMALAAGASEEAAPMARLGQAVGTALLATLVVAALLALARLAWRTPK